MINEKRKYMRRRDRLEEIILQLEKPNMDEKDKKAISELKLEIEDLLTNVPNDDHKLFLQEIIDIEKPSFSSNNLILAPVGSGKSVFIETLSAKGKGNILMLVSNRYLKNSVCPEDNELRKLHADSGKSQMMFTTKNTTTYGDEDYSIYVMTYAEFGNKIEFDDEFINKYNFIQIHCDEIHSLPEYKNIDKSEPLIHAIRYLFNKHERHKIFYYTATKDNLTQMEKSRPGTMRHVKIFNYLDHPNIRQYTALSEYKINHIEQIRVHLESRLKSFNYFGHKGLAFNKTISGQRKIAQILSEEGYNPLTLWSDTNSENKLTKAQITAREELIKTNKIPEPYNFLVINSAMREGWDLKDPKLKLAIMNTTNPTDKIQALGRIRKDIDVLIYRTEEDLFEQIELTIPDSFINEPLTVELKDDLCNVLQILTDKGEISKWPSLKKIITDNGYSISETRTKVNNTVRRVSIISRTE